MYLDQDAVTFRALPRIYWWSRAESKAQSAKSASEGVVEYAARLGKKIRSENVIV